MNTWRVAIVHDWLTGMRGGEKVLEALCEIYPQARLYTLIHVKGSVSPLIERHPITTAFTSRVPAARRLYRHLLPIFPIAVETFDLDWADLVVTSSHCAVKSVVAPGRARHLCYCHSPMRYAWDQFDWYFGRERMGHLTHLMRPTMKRLARWDRETAGRPSRYVANSQYVAGRIGRYYNRRSAVVPPPVDTGFFTPEGRRPAGFALVVSALVPYKRVGLAIEACRRVGLPLKVVGEGPERASLEKGTAGAVEFLGRCSDNEVRELYRGASVVILPGEEDFGLVPVEAQACGCPVVALGRGGSLETVTDRQTGLLVGDATPEAFARAIREVLDRNWDLPALRQNAERFSKERFVAGFTAQVDALMAAPPDQVRC